VRRAVAGSSDRALPAIAKTATANPPLGYDLTDVTPTRDTMTGNSAKARRPSVCDRRAIRGALFAAASGRRKTLESRVRGTAPHAHIAQICQKALLADPGAVLDRELEAGVANGSTSIEDPPGVRPNGAYLAYLRDPDGNKIVAVAR
jgi:hypothetical protein